MRRQQRFSHRRSRRVPRNPVLKHRLAIENRGVKSQPFRNVMDEHRPAGLDHPDHFAHPRLAPAQIIVHLHLVFVRLVFFAQIKRRIGESHINARNRAGATSPRGSRLGGFLPAAKRSFHAVCGLFQQLGKPRQFVFVQRKDIVKSVDHAKQIARAHQPADAVQESEKTAARIMPREQIADIALPFSLCRLARTMWSTSKSTRSPVSARACRG